VLIRSI